MVKTKDEIKVLKRILYLVNDYEFADAEVKLKERLSKI